MPLRAGQLQRWTFASICGERLLLAEFCPTVKCASGHEAVPYIEFFLTNPSQMPQQIPQAGIRYQPHQHQPSSHHRCTTRA